eukprot:CAMPEP_0119353998 /NCGR_PEP_ID=MMETSP1334-20130426/3084_1 /TAXON_ID=127549 /ORGANISM="Calcidiscus leptoporus, Strain RCC1130" /LENGTH=72 /DNA_ID=CAMNT_0007367433 /DNA_START=576 /DNA_END=791 /DNA_ORIENTATION=-
MWLALRVPQSSAILSEASGSVCEAARKRLPPTESSQPTQEVSARATAATATAALASTLATSPDLRRLRSTPP